MVYNNPTSINKGLLKNQICKPIYVDSQDDTVIEILSNIFPPAQLGILHSKNEAMHDMIPYLRSIVPNGDIVWHLKPIDEIDNFIIRKLGIASRKSYITSVKNIINTINSYSGMAVNNLCASQYLKKRNVPEIFLHIVLGDNILPFDIDQSLIEDVIDTAIKSTQI